MQDDLLYQQYFEPVKRYLDKFVGADYAEELAQEVFIKVIKSQHQFRGECSIKSWIYRIATNAAKDFLKSRYKKESDAISEQDLETYDASLVDKESPEVLNIAHEMNECIREFVYRLPDQYATILALSELEGQSIQQISELLELTKNTTKVRLHRARARLKDELEQGCLITTDCNNQMLCERKQ